MELQLRLADGEWHWHKLTFTGRGTGYVVAVAENVDDQDEQRRLRRDLENQVRMLDASVDCIKLINLDGSVRHMNRSGCLALGVPVDEKKFGMQWLDLLPQEIRPKGRRALRTAGRGSNARFAGKSVLPGCKPQYWDNLLTPMFDGRGAVTGIACVSRDVTAQRVAEIRLRVASDIDELTGLPNRRTFNRQLRNKLARARSNGQTLALLIIDLDHFKHVNDTLGHPAGDHLLRVLSRRISGLVGAGVLVARLGGDEFAVVVEDVLAEAEVVKLAGSVTLLGDEPVTYGGKIINGGMSIGCALFPRDAADPPGLMKLADTALHDIKANGRGGVQVYSRRLMEVAESAASQRDMARRLVRDKDVVAHYQPKVTLHDGNSVGYEAVMRWANPDTGLVGDCCPLDEAFKDYELATRLAELMHSNVLADMAYWQAHGLQLLPVAINAAPVEFMRDDFAERLLARLERYDVSPALVEIEITEQVLADRGSAFVVRALRKLKNAGVRIALDDFGTGHSSLAHLRDYPIDCLKIDRSFVTRMVEEPAIRAIVEAIGKLGPSLGLDLIAEGVETIRERDLLMAAGYDVGQGYLYSRAVSSKVVADNLQRQEAALSA